MRGWWGLLLVWVACSGSLFRITVEETSEAVVERNPLGTLLQDLGFTDFATMDITSSQTLRNQGVAPGDIREVFLEELTLRASAPEGADLAFIRSISFFVQAPGLDRVRIAHQDSFPEGEARVELELDDVDLTPYVVSERMTITTDARGTSPSQDTTVSGYAAFSVGVTRQGACAALGR